jgi:hypothetical protein
MAHDHDPTPAHAELIDHGPAQGLRIEGVRGSNRLSSRSEDGHERPSLGRRVQRGTPLVGGWIGVTVGLLNVYPTLYPWISTVDKALGILICVLISAVGARVVHASGEGTCDLILTILILALLLIIAFAAIPPTAGATI